jgi:hypothetical protein
MAINSLAKVSEDSFARYLFICLDDEVDNFSRILSIWEVHSYSDLALVQLR